MLHKIKTIKDSVTRKASKQEQEDDQLLVALDIGTEFVKALIGRMTEDGLEIIGVGRVHQELTDMQAGAIADIASVVKNCDEALTQAEEQAGVSTNTAVLGIAGELVKGITTTVRVKRKNPERELDMKEVERIIGVVQERAQQRANQQLAWELGGKDVEIRLVNSALVNIEIDGYPVTSPVGFKGKEVVVQLYTAFAPMIHIGALERTAKELNLDLVAVAAEPFAVSRAVIGDDPNASMSAILMDVGGGTTDIAVINDGGVQGTKMFGIGGRAYTRSLERDLGISFVQAEEIKLGLSQHKVPESKVPLVEKSLQKTLDVWTSGVELALAEFTTLDHLPRRIFLCGGGSSLDMLMRQLESSNWYADLPFTRKPVVQHIKPENVIGIKDTTKTITDHTFITAMGLLRVGLDTLQQESSQSMNGSFRQKIDKILKV